MLTFGYFGKLPIFPDFIRHNSGGSEISDIDKWIQDGITFGKNELKSRWKEQYYNSSAHNFVYPFTNSTKVLIGTIFPSRDKSEREFPFITFLRYDTKYLNIPAHLIPIQLSRIFNSFHYTYENFSKNINSSFFHVASFFQTEEDLSRHNQSQANSIFLNSLNSVQKDFWQRTSRNQGEDFKYDIINTLVYYLEGQQDKAIPTLSSGIKITFSSTRDHEELDLAFFIKLLLTISNKNSYMPAMFWTTKRDYTEAIFLLTKPLPKHFFSLISLDHNHNGVIDANTLDDTMIKHSVSPRLINILDNDNITLNELLQHYV